MHPVINGSCKYPKPLPQESVPAASSVSSCLKFSGRMHPGNDSLFFPPNNDTMKHSKENAICFVENKYALNSYLSQKKKTVRWLLSFTASRVLWREREGEGYVALPCSQQVLKEIKS